MRAFNKIIRLYLLDKFSEACNLHIQLHDKTYHLRNVLSWFIYGGHFTATIIKDNHAETPSIYHYSSDKFCMLCSFTVLLTHDIIHFNHEGDKWVMSEICFRCYKKKFLSHCKTSNNSYFICLEQVDIRSLD